MLPLCRMGVLFKNFKEFLVPQKRTKFLLKKSFIHLRSFHFKTKFDKQNFVYSKILFKKSVN